MSSGLREITVTFPVPVELTPAEDKALYDLISAICRRYSAANPGRAMWLGEFGALVTQMPMSAEDDANGVRMEFDESVYHLGVCEREDYPWPCAKCGLEQGDHKGLILDPKAGDCDFEPALSTQGPQS